jgi:ssDNA-specific exonuclease RecJ
MSADNDIEIGKLQVKVEVLTKTTDATLAIVNQTKDIQKDMQSDIKVLLTNLADVPKRVESLERKASVISGGKIVLFAIIGTLAWLVTTGISIYAARK